MITSVVLLSSMRPQPLLVLLASILMAASQFCGVAVHSDLMLLVHDIEDLNSDVLCFCWVATQKGPVVAKRLLMPYTAAFRTALGRGVSFIFSLAVDELVAHVHRRRLALTSDRSAASVLVALSCDADVALARPAS